MSKKLKDNVYYFSDRLKSSKSATSEELILFVLREHGFDLQRFLSARLAGHPDKDDLMQEILLRLVEQKDLQKSLSLSSEKVRAYLIVIASNLIRDTQRRHQVREKAHKRILLETDGVTDKKTPEQQMIMRQKLIQADKVLNSLPVKCREAFKLSRFYNVGYREIGEKMNISSSTVKKYIAKALVELRKKIDLDGDE